MDYNHNDLKLEPQAVAGNERDNLVAKKTAEDKAKAQKTELNAALMTAIKSPLTLVLAIAMTVITVSCFASAISSGVALFSYISIWMGIVALIDCIGIWKLWGFDKEITSKSLKSFKGYLSLQKALNVISLILFELLGAILMVISIALMVAFDKLSVNLSEIIYDVGSYLGYEFLIDPDTIFSYLIIGPGIIFLIALVVIIAATIYYTFINRALKKVIKYVKRLSNSIDGTANHNDDYDIDKKPPFISLIIFGGIYAIFAPFTLGIWNILCGLAIGVYFIFIALLFKKIHTEIENYSAMSIGSATHEFIENCDLESFNTTGSIAEIDRLVEEGHLSSDAADCVRLRLYEMECFRQSDVFREMLEAKRCEDAHMTMLLEKIRRTEYLEKMGLPRCIEEMDFGKLFDEIHVMTVIEQMRQSGDPRQIELADILDAETLHYELPEEILQPTTLDKIRNSKLFEDIRKAKRLYREYPIFMPDVPSPMSPHTLAILDCIIVKESGDVKIVDYKTDRLEKAELKNEAKATETFSFRYSPKFAKYADAVKLEFGKKPASAKLYSLQLGKALNIPINELPPKKYRYPEIKGRPS